MSQKTLIVYQNKKIHPFSVVLYVSIQLSYRHKHKTKLFQERQTQVDLKLPGLILSPVSSKIIEFNEKTVFFMGQSLAKT